MPRSETHARARSSLASEGVADQIAETMHALATPSRVRLLYALINGELSVGALARIADVTPTVASQQLRILRQLHLVVARREGQSVVYSLHDDHVASLLEEIRNHVEHAERGWL
jgi:ArsR family transcriptional regulator, nickel/cobalt-responsive transcriptional repressor